MLDICFVHMPFSQLGNPSMALSVLAASCCREGLECQVVYGNLRFAAAAGLKDYVHFMECARFFMLSGELPFKDYAGYPDSRTAKEYFQEIETYLQEDAFSMDKLPQLMKLTDKMKACAKSFLEKLSEDILALQPRIVACDITYDQRNAVLSLFKLIKEKSPATLTLLGGNSCTGVRGQALVDYCEFVDGCFSGETDDIIVPACKMLLAGAATEAVHAVYPSFMTRGTQGDNGWIKNMDVLPLPDFSDYFSELKQYGLKKFITPCLLIEGSRGCWWGEKQRCNFCGIHTCVETLQYRQKSSVRILREITEQAQLYRCKSFVFTDCILSRNLLEELPELLQADGGDYHFFAEIKSNLNGRQLAALKKAGFIRLQPGIEAIQDDLLRLMNKGNRAIKHLELLKLCRENGITLVWNLLAVMPFDKKEYYDETIRLIPLLTHLQPATHVGGILYQRSSTYTRNAEKFGLQLEPVSLYKYIGDYGGSFISDTAEYYLDRVRLDDKQRDSVITDLRAALDGWLAASVSNGGDRLFYYYQGDALEVMDLRRCAQKTFYTMRGLRKSIYEAAEHPVKLKELFKLLAPAAEEDIRQELEFLRQQGLVAEIGGEVLALAVAEKVQPYVEDPILPVGRIQLE